MNNKLLFDYGSIWSKKELSDKQYEYPVSRNLPLPDGITCGQIVTEDFFLPNETENHPVNDSDKLESVKVRTRKHVSKKFPLKFDACATPFLNQSDYELLPGDPNKRYLNIVSTYELNNINQIVYGEYGKESNVLKISTLSELDDEKKGEIILDSSQDISEYKVLHQVQADVINGIPYILLIVDDTVSFLRVKEEGFDLCCVESKDTTSSCLNKDLSNCFSFTKEGIVNLFDINKEKVRWRCNLNKSYKTKKYTQCEFGSNPFNIWVSCESEVILADTRVESHEKRKVFDTEKYSIYLYSDKEIINSFKHTQDSPLFYIACSNTLLLMDERYCKYPVLNWYHMIKGRPSHIHRFKRNEIDFILMADPEKSQLCFTSLKSNNAEYPDLVSLSTPFHKNIVTDTVLLARENEIALSDLTEKQIFSPLVGLSVLSFSFGHAVVFQNNYGNLFYFNCYDRKTKQDLKSKERAIEHLKTFEKFVGRKIRKDYLKNCPKGKYLEGYKVSRTFKSNYKTIKKGERFDKFIWDLTSYDHYRLYSKFFTRNEMDERDQSEDSYFCEKDRDYLSAEFIKNCSDEFSQKLLSSWSSNFSDFSSLDAPVFTNNLTVSFRYQSCPYFLDNEDAGDIPMLNMEAERETTSANISNGDNLTKDLGDLDFDVNNKSMSESLCLSDTKEDERNLDSSINNESRKKNLCLSDTKNSENLSDSSTSINSKRKSLCLSDKKKKKKSRMDGF